MRYQSPKKKVSQKKKYSPKKKVSSPKRKLTPKSTKPELPIPKNKKLKKTPKDKETGIPKKYVPKGLSKEDREKQIESIKEKKARPKVEYKNKRSSHIIKFEKKYGRKITDSAWIGKNLLKAKGQKLIIDKGEGAYYSGGSRPNQTPTSWGLARLASALTGGKAAKVDKDILVKYGVNKVKQE